MIPSDLPVYKLLCSEFDKMTDVERVDLVTTPAIRQNWVMLSDINEPVMFQLSADEQRILTGAVLIPDLPIKRFQPVEPNGQPIMFYAVADKETVRNTAKMYSRNHKLDAVGLMHESAINDGVHLFQTFVSDSENGISNPKGFENLPDGTWYMSFLIDDDNIWNEAKAGKLNGFSIQTFFGLEKSDTPIDTQLSELLADIETLTAKFQNISKKAI